MNNTEALREFAEKWTDGKYRRDTDAPVVHLLSDLTALISEHYVPKDDYDKLGRLMDQLAEADEKQTSGLLRQRDELREELIAYDKYIGNKGWIDNYEDDTAEPTVDEYLENVKKS